MDDQLKSHKENTVWDAIPKPKGRKIVARRWVYTIKGDAQGEIERYHTWFIS
jgi:hypothetical protein